MQDTRLGLELAAVSCPTASRCWALGRAGTGGGTVVVQMINGVWTVSPTRVPTNESLGAIDCLSITSCWAVGTLDSTSSTEVPTAVHYNGRSWTRFSVPTPSSIGAQYLNAVTCSSATSCWAVGGREGTTPLGRALIEHYNGRTWSIVASPGPGNDSLLSAVSCTSASSCWAVGVSNSFAVSSKGGSLVEHYNGHSWSQAKAPNVVGGLSSVSCQWPGACFSNGLQYSNGAWREVSGFSGTTSIGCSSSSSCWGVYFTSGIYNPSAAQFWDGSTWSSVARPTWPSGYAEIINAISCSPGGPCVAVGGEVPISATGRPTQNAVSQTKALAELLGIGHS